MTSKKSDKIIKYFRSSLPSLLWLVLGYKCNSQCVHCYAQNALNRSFISKNIISRTINLLSFIPIQQIVLIGGEPTLFPYIGGLMNQLVKLVDKISIVSNGKKLASKKYTEYLKKIGISTIDISIGNDRNLKNLSVNFSPLDEQLKGLQNAVDVFTTEKVSAVVTIGNQEIEFLKFLIKKIEQRGIRKMAINFAVPVISNLDITPEFSSPPDIVATKIVLLYEFIINKTIIQPIFYLNLPLCLFKPDFLHKIFMNGHAVSGCHAISGEGLVIDPFGNFLPCTHWVDTSNFNIEEDWELIKNENSFRDFWKNGKPGRWSRFLAQFRHGYCINCRLAGRTCFGGCPLIWLYYNPEEFIPGIQI